MDDAPRRRLSETARAVSGRRLFEDSLTHRSHVAVRCWKGRLEQRTDWVASCTHDGCTWEEVHQSWQEARVSAHYHEEDQHEPRDNGW